MKIVDLAPSPSSARHLAWTVGSLIFLLAWDATGLDLALARLMAPSGGFAIRDNWFLTTVLHQGGRQLAWLLGLGMLVALRWPVGWLRQLPLTARMQLLTTSVLALLLINALKYTSHTSCPWDLSEFGGMGDHVSHWAWGRPDGGPGHCFPAGHASAGFAFVAGYFVLRPFSPRQAAQWLVVALLAGLALGLGQQLRGAHFMSHTLWTGWLCWTCALVVDTLARARPRMATIRSTP